MGHIYWVHALSKTVILHSALTCILMHSHLNATLLQEHSLTHHTSTLASALPQRELWLRLMFSFIRERNSGRSVTVTSALQHERKCMYMYSILLATTDLYFCILWDFGECLNGPPGQQNVSSLEMCPFRGHNYKSTLPS